jgi:hypothetical protein
MVAQLLAYFISSAFTMGFELMAYIFVFGRPTHVLSSGGIPLIGW